MNEYRLHIGIYSERSWRIRGNLGLSQQCAVQDMQQVFQREGGKEESAARLTQAFPVSISLFSSSLVRGTSIERPRWDNITRVISWRQEIDLSLCSRSLRVLSVTTDCKHAFVIPVHVDLIQDDPRCTLHPTISFFFFRSFLVSFVSHSRINIQGQSSVVLNPDPSYIQQSL